MLPDAAKAPSTSPRVRAAIDIGGTFTDVALEAGDRRVTAKVLTTPARPEQGFIEALGLALAEAGLSAADLGLIIHGTTLATNALIERKGARVALLCTEGFRDSIEMAYEHRFEQSDLFMVRPPPLVPRRRRYGIPERLSAQGSVLLPLEESAVEALVPALAAERIEAVAIGFLHSYVNPDHERRVRDILARRLPGIPISLSSDVSPEIREYDRLSTTVANAYVQPLVGGYLKRLQEELARMGASCPLLLMMSSGAMVTLETACSFPVRLLESGPAGGAILAKQVAAECGRSKVVSFDMGGTTAKICLIDDYAPQISRSLEVARQYRFLRGSGLPLRIPVIDMVEIGAGGGSIASVDALGRINVGPESAGSVPGPACYGRGGDHPTVTDADLAMGRLSPERFAGGRLRLVPERALAALEAEVGRKLDLDPVQGAAGVSEIVDENMANAARVHGIESGKELAPRTLIAFGGAAPLHACRLATKLRIDDIVVPVGAGVGSAIGFLRANIAYEVVRSRYLDMRQFDPDTVNGIFAEMRAEAEAVVRMGAPDEPLAESRTAFMRYRGQGHEIAVPLPCRRYSADDAREFEAVFAREYRTLYGRTIPRLSLEVMTWTLAIGTSQSMPAPATVSERRSVAVPSGRRRVFDADRGAWEELRLYWRQDLPAGSFVAGPAVIAEDQTSTLVTAAFDAFVNEFGHLVLSRKSAR